MLKSLLAQVLPKSKAAPAAAALSPRASALDQARALAAQRKWVLAGELTQRLLSEPPEDVEVLLLHAKTLRARGLLEDAKRCYRRALVLEPRRAEAWLDLGVCHAQEGDHFWARVYFRFARELDPANAEAWNEFGVVEIALGNFEEAEQSLENAVNQDPELAEAWNNLGLVLARRGDLENARRHFLRSTFLKPQDYMAHCNLGLACRELELHEEASAALRRALAIDASKPTAPVNLSMVLQDEGKLDDALRVLEPALGAHPEDADVLTALSGLRLRRGEIAAAQETAERALVLDGQNADAELALAYARLAAGDFRRGWPHYEARLRSRQSPLSRFGFPAWAGQDLAGMSVLVYGEQGLGDEIMFASCLPDLAERAGRCTLLCSPRLAALFRRSFPGVEVIDSSTQLEHEWRHGARQIDVAVPAGSLPSLFRTDWDAFPSRPAFLRADEARTVQWRNRLAALGTGLKVGISWRGGLPRTGRTLRSLALADLEPLLRLGGIRWVSLQHDRKDDEHDERISFWDASVRDPDDAASLICALDVVVTVCSTVVHLAGGLGCPVWVLTPKAPTWRYLMEGDRLPWYPSARLFRQTRALDWAETLDRMADQLGTLTVARS